MGFLVSVCLRKPTVPEKPYFFTLNLAKVLKGKIEYSCASQKDNHGKNNIHKNNNPTD